MAAGRSPVALGLPGSGSEEARGLGGPSVRFLDLGEVREHPAIARGGLEDRGQVRRGPGEVARRRGGGHGREDRTHRFLDVALRQANPRELDAARLAAGVERQTLLGRAHGLRGLARLELRLREEREPLRGRRRFLQHRDGRGRVPLGEEGTHEPSLDFSVAGDELERLLEDGDRLVVGAALRERAADDAVLRDGMVDLPVGSEQVGQARLNLQVGWIDRGHFLVGRDRVLGPVVLQVMVGQHLVLAARVLRQALLVVEVRELLVDLEASRVDLVDLLVDRDRLQEKAVLGVEVGDPCEEGDRIGGAVDPDVEVPDLVQRRDVLRVLVEHPQVLLERRVELSPGEELLGALKDLIPIRHVW
jgi:hypothetical protein